MSFGGGVHPTGAVALNLYADDADEDKKPPHKIELGSILGKRVRPLGRSAGRVDPATGRCPTLMSVDGNIAVPVVATALSNAPIAAGRVPRRSPFAAQVAGLTVCRKNLVISDIMPGSVAYAKRVKHRTTKALSFKLVGRKYRQHDSVQNTLGEWTDADEITARPFYEQPFGLCVSGAKAGCAIDVILGGMGSAFVVGHKTKGVY